MRILLLCKWPFSRAAVETEFLPPYPSYTHRKSCDYPHRIPIPTEPQNPTYPYQHLVFSLQEAYFNLLFVTLTVGYYTMHRYLLKLAHFCCKRNVAVLLTFYMHSVRIMQKYRLTIK